MRGNKLGKVGSKGSRRCLGQWHRERVSLAKEKKKSGGIALDIWRKQVGRGRMEEPNLGSGFFAAHHQGNHVATATAKAAPPLSSTSWAAFTSKPPRHFRMGVRAAGNGFRRRELLPQ